MEHINIGLSDASRTQTVDLLKKIQADTFVLFAKTKYYHWNVKGRFFTSLHLLFDEQAGILSEMLDDTAERIRALGFPAIGTLKDYSELTQLTEDSSPHLTDILMIHQLVTDHETVIRRLRTSIDQITEWNDAGTADFLTGSMEQHEKMAWMLRSQQA